MSKCCNESCFYVALTNSVFCMPCQKQFDLYKAMRCQFELFEIKEKRIAQEQEAAIRGRYEQVL